MSQTEVILRIAIFGVAFGWVFLSITLILAQAIKSRVRAAYFWLAAYTPLILILLLTMLDNFSIIQPLGLSYALPAYALVFEAVVLLFALHMHAKNRHAIQERERVMSSIDPLTGFLSAKTFNERLALHWSRLLGSSQDISFALIYIYHRSEAYDAESALKLEKKLLRSVRLINTITRDIDMIGRVGGNVLALAMPGIPMGDDLNNRLARLIAMGMMTDPYDTSPTELRFRIAVSTRASWGDDLKSLDNYLRGIILQSNGWSRKPIRYITALASHAASHAASPDTAQGSAQANGARQQRQLAQGDTSSGGSSRSSSGSSGDSPAFHRDTSTSFH